MRKLLVANLNRNLLTIALVALVHSSLCGQAPSHQAPSHYHAHVHRTGGHAANPSRTANAVHHSPQRPSFARHISRVSHQALVAPTAWVQGSYSSVGGPACSSASGCTVRACHTRCFGRPQPLGSVLQSSMDMQIQNGRKSRLVMYEYDFEESPTRDRTALTQAGRRKLERLVPILESTGHVLVIEPSTDYSGISESRRMHVVNVLETEMNFSNASGQVVLRNSRLPGLRGVEAVEIDRSQLNTTRSQGTTFSSSGGSSGFSPTSGGSGGSSGFSN